MACTLEAHVHTARKHPAVTSLPLSAVGSGFSSLSGERLFGVDKLSVFQILIQLQSALAKKLPTGSQLSSEEVHVTFQIQSLSTSKRLTEISQLMQTRQCM